MNNLDIISDNISKQLAGLKLMIGTTSHRECKICGKPAVWSVRGDGYCDEHIELNKSQKRALRLISIIMQSF
jgi:predicted nucleic acid-binding Zn ribbon protein